MTHAVAILSNGEAIASERELLRGETSPLRSAKGFVFGSIVSGVIWTMVALLAWSLV